MVESPQINQACGPAEGIEMMASSELVRREGQQWESNGFKVKEGVEGDQTYFHLGLELISHLTPIFHGLLFRETMDGASIEDPSHRVHDFKEKTSHKIVNFYPHKGTVFHDAFRAMMGNTSQVVGFSVFQPIQKQTDETKPVPPVGFAPNGLLLSCALVRQPTNWMRLYNVPAALMEQIGYRPGEAERVYARVLPPAPSERHFESRLEFFHTDTRVTADNRATVRLSEVASSRTPSGQLKDEGVVIRPLDADDILYLQGLETFTEGLPLLSEIFGAPAAETPRLPKAKPLGLKGQQALLGSAEASPEVVQIAHHRPQ